MIRMMKRLGLEPDIVNLEGTEAIIGKVGCRYRKCRSEAVCEGWLEAIEGGGTALCSNARVFEALKSIGQALIG